MSDDFLYSVDFLKKKHAWHGSLRGFFQSSLMLTPSMGRAPAQHTSCLLYPVISGIGITHQGKPAPIGQLSLYHLFSTTIAYIYSGQKNRYACVYIAVFYDVLLDSLMFLIVHHRHRTSVCCQVKPTHHIILL